MSRREFSARVRQAAWKRSEGRCEAGCGTPIGPGNGPEYHHQIEAALGGEATLENCVVACRTCHRIITSERAAPMAKAARLERKDANITARKAIIPGSKGSPWKRRIDGTTVRREP